MGGARAGEVASQLALATIAEMQKAGTASLEDEVREANRIVFARAGEDERYAGMGTTLTAVLASPEAIHLAHVGDSRAYLARAGTLRQLTAITPWSTGWSRPARSRATKPRCTPTATCCCARWAPSPRWTSTRTTSGCWRATGSCSAPTA